MDDRDLELLREFRRDEAEPPAYLQGRIEERLWQAILAEEQAGAARSRTRAHRSWRESLLRPLVAAGAAASLALGVAVVSDGGSGASGAAGGVVTQAGSSGLFDGTASTMFGGGSNSAAPIVGSIDLSTDGTADGQGLAAGPRHDPPGVLDGDTAELARSLSRDPRELRDLVRDGVEDMGLDDPDDRAAFRVTMQWIVDPAVPVDLRAAMLRSLAGLDGIDEARAGVDVLGRSGVVVGHLDATSGVRTQAVLAPDGGTLLEVRSFTTTYVDPACEPGTFTEHATYADDGSWIDPNALPWVDWPLVVAACGEVSG